MRSLGIASSRLLTLTLLTTTAVTALASWHWIADLLANLRIQQLIALSIALLVSLLARQKRLAVLCVACIAVQLISMRGEWLPNLRSIDRSEASEFRLLTVNVLTSNSNHDAIIREILDSDADLFSVLELNTQLKEKLVAVCGETYPFSAGSGSDLGNFGIALFSKHPLQDTQIFQLNEPIDSIAVTCRGMRIYATHPLPPMGESQFRSRNEHFDRLADRVTTFSDKNASLSTVVMGDFNLTPWSPWFSKFTESTGLRRAKSGFGIQPTWYAKGNLFPLGLVLDHVLIDPRLRCLSHRVGAPIGSDHRSVLVTVTRR